MLTNGAGLTRPHFGENNMANKTTKIELLRPCVAGGKPRAAGAIVPVPARDARYLIGIGKAKPAPAKPAK